MRKRVYTPCRPVDLVTDMAALLDLVGVDHVDQHQLDNVLHNGYSAASLLSFADQMVRRTGRCRFTELLAEFTQEAAA